MDFSDEEIASKMRRLEAQEEDPEIELNIGVSTNGSVCNLEHSEDSQHSAPVSVYASLYKATNKPLSQDKRRKELLKNLKERRNETVNIKRGSLLKLILNGDLNDIEVGQEDPQVAELMDTFEQPPHQQQPSNLKENIYKNKLMLSEWLKEIPDDLESEWVMKLCPPGVRNLLVARRGSTRAYSKKGALLAKFQSALPGGNGCSTDRRHCTLLDTIFSKELQCYYIIDVLAWQKCDLSEADVDFRFFWLKSRLSESPEFKRVAPNNCYPLYELEATPAELPLIQDKLSRPYTVNDEVVDVDGILFFHRSGLYVSKRTELVGWLKPYMVPEKLGVDVGECHMSKMPADYQSMQQYIESLAEKFKDMHWAPPAPVLVSAEDAMDG